MKLVSDNYYCAKDGPRQDKTIIRFIPKPILFIM